MERVLLTAADSLEVFEGYIEDEEREHYFYYRLDELIKLTQADDGKIFYGEIDFEQGEDEKFDRENPPKGWVKFERKECRGKQGIEVELFLKNPKMQPFIEKLIEVYMQDWLNGWFAIHE